MNTIKKGALIYKGKAKDVFETNNPDKVIMYFKDDATAFNGKKHSVIEGKGKLNLRLCKTFFEFLKNKIPMAYEETINEREMLQKKVQIIPLEVVVRNKIAGSLAKRFGKEEGSNLPFPMIEYFYKDDALDDPQIIKNQIAAFNIANKIEMQKIEDMALKINTLLKYFLYVRGITLVDFKVEFGRYYDDIVLADDITPDGARLWDIKTETVFDKDRFRRNLGDLIEGYNIIADRIGA